MARSSRNSRGVDSELSAAIRSREAWAQASSSRQPRLPARNTTNTSCYVSYGPTNGAEWNDAEITGFSRDGKGLQDPVVFTNGYNNAPSIWCTSGSLAAPMALKANTEDKARHKARKGHRYTCNKTTLGKSGVCGMRFLEQTDLQRHHEKQHAIETVPKQDCPSEKCNLKGERGFRRQNALAEHVRRYHPTLVASLGDGTHDPWSRVPLMKSSARSPGALLSSENQTPLFEATSVSGSVHSATQALASMTLNIPAPKQSRYDVKASDDPIESRPPMAQMKSAMHAPIAKAKHNPTSALQGRTTPAPKSDEIIGSTGPTAICRTPSMEPPNKSLVHNQHALCTPMTLPFRPRSHSSISNLSIWSTDSEPDDDQCEDGSVSEHRQEFESDDDCLNRRFFDDVMRQACHCINALLSGQTYGAQDADQKHTTATSHQHESTSGATARSSNASDLNTGRGLGRRLPSEPDRDDNDGDDNGSRKQGPAGREPVPTASLNFACPFFKHNPAKYAKCRAIVNNEVRRIKAHIYARHERPYCERCKNIFDSDDAVTEHSDQSAECQRRDFPEDFDSITKSQGRMLHDKKRLAPTEEERWRNVYQIIFRITHESEIPCPYATMSVEQYRHLTNFKDGLLQRLPDDMITQLEPHAGDFGDAFQRLIEPIKQIVSDAVDREFQAYLLSSPSSDVKVPIRNDPQSTGKASSSIGRDRLSAGSSAFGQTSPHTPRSERSHGRRRSRSPLDGTPIRPAAKRPRIETTNLNSSPYLQVTVSPSSFLYSDYTTSSGGDGSLGVLSRKASSEFTPLPSDGPLFETVRENLTGIGPRAGIGSGPALAFSETDNTTDMGGPVDFNMQNGWYNGWDEFQPQDFNRELDAAAASVQETTDLRYQEASSSQPMSGVQASPQTPGTPQILITPGPQPLLRQASWSPMNRRIP